MRTLFLKKCAHFLLTNITFLESAHCYHTQTAVKMTPQELPKKNMCLDEWMVLTNVAYLIVTTLCYLIVSNHFKPLINHHNENLNLTRSIEVGDNKAIAGICVLQ